MEENSENGEEKRWICCVLGVSSCEALSSVEVPVFVCAVLQAQGCAGLGPGPCRRGLSVQVGLCGCPKAGRVEEQQQEPSWGGGNGRGRVCSKGGKHVGLPVLMM